MAPLVVLVHSPLVGPTTWEAVAEHLAALGYGVRVPDLTGTVAAGQRPPYCPRQASVIAASAGSHPALLVGHSGAGPLLAAAGARAGGARGYIFADAGLPTPGQAWMDTVPPELARQVRDMAGDTGWLPPWSRWWSDDELAGLLPDPDLRCRFADSCPPLPLALFEETHPVVPPDWAAVPAGYLQLSEAYLEQAAAARDRGWPVLVRESQHLAPVTDPGMVGDALHELLRRLDL